MNISLEAAIQSTSETKSMLGRAVGMSVAIKGEEPSPYITAGPRPAKQTLKIDETKFVVGASEKT